MISFGPDLKLLFQQGFKDFELNLEALTMCANDIGKTLDYLLKQDELNGA